MTIVNPNILRHQLCTVVLNYITPRPKVTNRVSRLRNQSCRGVGRAGRARHALALMRLKC